MTNNIENKVDALISKEITAQNIMEDINNKAQAEELFRITMYSSFEEKHVFIFEFIKWNCEDNIVLQRETVDVCLHEISKCRKSAKKK